MQLTAILHCLCVAAQMRHLTAASAWVCERRPETQVTRKQTAADAVWLTDGLSSPSASCENQPSTVYKSRKAELKTGSVVIGLSKRQKTKLKFCT